MALASSPGDGALVFCYSVSSPLGLSWHVVWGTGPPCALGGGWSAVELEAGS